MTLRIEKLNKSFKDVKALKSLNFVLEEGASVALLGPNGAGKSTAIKVMTTLLPPDGGSFNYRGEDLFAQPGKIRQLLGYVSQEMAMDKMLTGKEFIQFVAGILHLPWKTHGERAMSLIKEMGLEDAAGRLVGTYSGGMKRRLDLASALLHDPKILVLDEPTTGLDIEAREKIWGLIKNFMAKGGSLILASHDFREVDELAQQVLIMNAGEVIVSGTPETLKCNLADYIVRLKTRDYMAEADNRAVQTALKSLGDSLTAQKDEDHAAFTYKGDADMKTLQDRIHAELGKAGLTVNRLFVQKPDLEDVYRFATGSAS